MEKDRLREEADRLRGCVLFVKLFAAIMNIVHAEIIQFID
jgi:hypothetical protein